MRMRRAARCLSSSVLLGAGLLGGCAHRVEPTAPPNPFGYMKPSAVCVVGPVSKTASGLLTTMKARSDDGLCSVRLTAPDGGAYASFLLSTLPAHGTSFIYNYNGRTVVTYTATTAYAGNDAFRVSLVPQGGAPRVPLTVNVAVDATGVTPPPLPPAPGKPTDETPAAGTSSGGPSAHHGVRRHRHVVHKRH